MVDNRTIYLGPPGTGKTHQLLSVLKAEIEAGINPRRIAYVAFTKKAAQLAKDRAMRDCGLSEEDLPFFRTLHSLAFRQLGLKRDQIFQWTHAKELGEKLGMSLRSKKNVEDGTTYGMTREERLMFIEGLSRIKMEDLRVTWANADEEEVDWWELERYSRALKEYKASRLVIDYTDMIEHFVRDAKFAAPPLDVVILDEAQDLSAIQWSAVEKISEKAKRVYVAGDDDQCSIQGSLVDTTGGQVPVEELDPSIHRLLSWRRDTHCVHGKNTGGFEFNIKRHRHVGKIVEVSCDGNVTGCTPDHRWYVRFSNAVTNDQSYRAIYLMRKGDWFRVGQCQVFGSKRQLHLSSRFRNEGADAIWVLLVTTSKDEAFYQENFISAKYGIPQTVFNAAGAKNIDSATISRLFESLDTRKAALQCLIDHGRDVNFPFMTRERSQTKVGGTPIFELEAMNILSGLMEIPIPHHRKDSWGIVETRFREYDGLVYGLEVRPHHTYIVDGMVTKNCIYKWAGADVQRFIDLQGQVTILDQSKRVPNAIHEMAEGITRQISNRRPKTYRPKEDEHGNRIEGAVKYYSDAEEVDISHGSWLLLARNGYQLLELEEMCIRNGYSFESVSSSPLHSDSLKALLSWETLRKNSMVPVEEAVLISKFMTPGKGISKNTRELLKKADTASFVSLLDLTRLYEFSTKLAWFDALDRITDKEREYFRAALKRKETLTRTPRISISTIHGAKGGEAENVLLLTDMSFRTFTQMQKYPDDEHRVWYVGLTRTSDKLHVIAPKTNLCYDL